MRYDRGAGKNIETPRVDAFLAEVEAVCQRHGLALSAEDLSVLVVEPYEASHMALKDAHVTAATAARERDAVEQADDAEDFYDTEVAPALLQLGRRCEEHGVPFYAIVEWARGKRGHTAAFPKGVGLAMQMHRLLGFAGENVDEFFILLKRLCDRDGIDYKQSAVMMMFERSK